MTGISRVKNKRYRFVSGSNHYFQLLILLSFLIIPPVYSATINVTSRLDILSDDGMCTLREAVISANEDIATGGCNAGLGPDTIILTVPGTYSFSIGGRDEDLSRTGDLDILSNLTIIGENANTHVINAAFLDRVIFSSADLTIKNITITGGRLNNSSLNNSGGGIYINGILTLENSIVEGNSVFGSNSKGGGIYSAGFGELTLTDSIIRNNHSDNDGGGLYRAWATNSTNVTGCTFDNNTSDGRGGGIYFPDVNSGHKLDISDTLFSINSATRGGAINTRRNTHIIDSTFYRNSAEFGGAIYAWSSSANVMISNSTLNENAGTFGGGINSDNSDITIHSVTIDQGVNFDSSAIYNDNGSVTLANTLIIGDCDGDVLASSGGNIESPGNTCEFIDLSDKNSVSQAVINLQPLKDNGGSTPSQLPGLNSIAIEGGLFIACASNDQREVVRPQDFDGLNGAECDVGAIELKPCSYDKVLNLENEIVLETKTFEACERIEAGNNFSITSPADVKFSIWKFSSAKSRFFN